jgi:hypothetical protein
VSYTQAKAEVEAARAAIVDELRAMDYPSWATDLIRATRADDMLRRAAHLRGLSKVDGFARLGYLASRFDLAIGVWLTMAVEIAEKSA